MNCDGMVAHFRGGWYRFFSVAGGGGRQGDRRNSKHQIPNPKEAPNPKFQNQKKGFFDLGIGISLEFGAWNLEFQHIVGSRSGFSSTSSTSYTFFSGKTSQLK
jgi:hypothetical protein